MKIDNIDNEVTPDSNGDSDVNAVTTSFVVQPLSEDGCLRRHDVEMFEALFDNLLDVYFYAKDINGRWISCNTASLKLLNLTKVRDVIGVKEEDFFPKKIAEDIWQDDQKILNNGQSVLNRVELITNSYGELIWVNTNKLPIYSTSKKVIGIIGITRPIMEQKELPQKYELFNGVVEYIRENLTSTIMISDLAREANLSESQLRRKFKQEFGLSPQAFIRQARLQAAAHLLRTETNTISQVAFQSGFSDQSYFTRQFKIFFGKTPKSYSQSWKFKSE